MPFKTAVSGLQAASADLKVIGNNVANVSTTGFKSSRAQFADVYAASVLGSSSTAIGSGVRLADVTQEFTQGTISFTNNLLDMAINGQGFFRLSDAGSTVYSRAGNFHVDKDGFIVNSTQQRLTGYLADNNGAVTGQLGDLRIDASNIDPQATARVDAALNLDANSVAPALPWGGPFAYGDPPPDPDSYNFATSLSVFDSLGNSHELSLFFAKTGANAWDVHTLADGVTVGASPAGTLQFNDAGTIDTATSQIDITGWQPLGLDGQPNGAAVQDLTARLTNTTQFGSEVGVNALAQDGFTTGRLAGIDVDASGLMFGRYTNGQSKPLGQVALANFANPQGLQPTGDTAWGESFASGPPLVGAPGSASLGVVQSGALEESNVELTAELVNMILAQRNFQANAQTVSTADAVTQTILQLR